MSIKLYHGDCNAILKEVITDTTIIVTDPPFNIGYHYNTYKDHVQEDTYYNMLISMMYHAPCVFIHYPESLHELTARSGKIPKRVVSWVYNSNTAKQHRDIAFYGIKPDFRKVRQPYKNPNDKRIKERIKNGMGGGDCMIGGTSTRSRMSPRKITAILASCRQKSWRRLFG